MMLEKPRTKVLVRTLQMNEPPANFEYCWRVVDTDTKGALSFARPVCAIPPRSISLPGFMYALAKVNKRRADQFILKP
jgi:hypothetical protein